MMNSYRKALEIAKEVHKSQTDLSGKPYILHPLHVAKHVKGKKTKIVALLHDVVEDGNITLDYLSKYFTPDICESVKLLTKKPDQDYIYYIYIIKKNRMARTVKIADLEHNMDIKRLDSLTDADYKRLKKYLNAYKELKDER